MSLAIHLLGFAFIIGGVAWALMVMDVRTEYVMIATLILIGIGILTGVSHTRSKD